MSIETKTGTVKVNNDEIYYEVIGEGQPLMMCHAGFVDSGMWNHQVVELASNYQVIRYDMVGYGKSSSATQPISRRQELYDVMQALEIDEAILMGCSLGGTTAIDFALDCPEKVTTLILVSATPSGFELQGDPPPYMFEMFGALQAGDIAQASELQTRIWFDGMYREPEQVDAQLRQQVKAMNLNALPKHGFLVGDSQPLNPLTPSAVTRLSDIQIPTCIIAGSLDHPEIMRATTLMNDSIDGSVKHIINDTAHLPNVEQPDTFNQIVNTFLSDI